MKGLVMAMAVGLAMGGMARAADAPVQVKNSFAFEVHASLQDVAPLFGPEGERCSTPRTKTCPRGPRCWAGKDWNPVFVWPRPAKDVQGAVFTVQHGEHSSVWVNTVFDLGKGRMQYVAVVPGAMAFTVDVRLTVVSTSLVSPVTKVEVTYTRTALDAGLNKEIKAMGKRDRTNGSSWKRDIDTALARGGACVEAAK